MEFGEIITNHEYHHGEQWGKLVSSSKFSRFYVSPAAFRWPLPPKGAPHFDFGNVVHRMVLEPQKEIMVLPANGFATKDDKATWMDWLEAHGIEIEKPLKHDILEAARKRSNELDMPMCTPNEYMQAASMARSILNCDDAMDALNGGVYERSFRHGRRKARPDCINRSLIADVKTTSSFNRWHHEAREYMYAERMAFYARTIEACTDLCPDYWAWIVVDKNPYRLDTDSLPVHRVMVYFAHEAVVEDAFMAHDEAWERFEECENSDSWPDDVRTSTQLYPWAN